MYEYEIKIDRVVDGDTVDGWIELGFNISTKKRIRLYGINAPESRTTDLAEKAKGLESKAWLVERLEGKTVTVKTEKDSSGKYGRTLGTLFIDSVNINTEMIAKGLAQEYT